MTAQDSTTITEFLEARIAEDEAEANACLRVYREGGDSSKLRWVRALAECAAKRAILQSHDMLDQSTKGDEWTWGYTAATHDALRAMASVYKDHPDYREAW